MRARHPALGAFTVPTESPFSMRQALHNIGRHPRFCLIHSLRPTLIRFESKLSHAHCVTPPPPKRYPLHWRIIKQNILCGHKNSKISKTPTAPLPPTNHTNTHETPQP